MSTPDDLNLNELVFQLSVVDGNEAEEAQWELQEVFGYKCVPRVVEVFPTLPWWGKTCALDLLNVLTLEPAPDEQTRQLVEKTALAMLNSDTELHREYSAGVLGSIGSHHAVAPLVRALDRSRACGTPGEDSEPMAIRDALRRLGYKTRYESDAVLGKLAVGFSPTEGWYVGDAIGVLDELLHNQQLVVGLQSWTEGKDGKLYWSSHNEERIWEIDYSKPFETLVIESHHKATEHLGAITDPRRTLVTMDWLGRDDLHTFPRTTQHADADARRVGLPMIGTALDESGNVSLGDNVRIRATEETKDAGMAGIEGQVYGETTPSITNVEVIGSPADDHAINVYLTERGEAHWFAPELVEFLDHAPGTEIRLDGVDKRWTRTADGGWHEESLAEKKRPWWKFW